MEGGGGVGSPPPMWPGIEAVIQSYRQFNADCEVEKEELTGKMNRLQAEISSKRTQLDNLATRLASLARLQQTLVSNHGHETEQAGALIANLRAIAALGTSTAVSDSMRATASLSSTGSDSNLRTIATLSYSSTGSATSQCSTVASSLRTALSTSSTNSTSTTTVVAATSPKSQTISQQHNSSQPPSNEPLLSQNSQNNNNNQLKNSQVNKPSLVKSNGLTKLNGQPVKSQPLVNGGRSLMKNGENVNISTASAGGKSVPALNRSLYKGANQPNRLNKDLQKSAI